MGYGCETAEFCDLAATPTADEGLAISGISFVGLLSPFLLLLRCFGVLASLNGFMPR